MSTAEPHVPAVAGSTPVPPGTADTDWVSAHVFYQGDLTELILDGAAPLAREMMSGGLVSGWFFLRYWDGGTHLRLRVLPAGGRDRGTVQELIAERLGRYLLEHPSAELLRQDDYDQYAPVLAAREGMASHTESLYPNNSVVFLPYRREHNRYGHGRCVEAVERHFVESSRLAAALLHGQRQRDHSVAAPPEAQVPGSLGGWRGREPGRRDTAAFSVILLTWLVCQPDPVRLAEAGGRLYRGWGRGLDGVDEADFDERYHRQRDRLADMARHVRDIAAGLAHEVAGRGVLAWWGASVLRLRDALAREVAEGHFTPPIREHPLSPTDRLNHRDPKVQQGTGPASAIHGDPGGRGEALPGRVPASESPRRPTDQHPGGPLHTKRSGGHASHPAASVDAGSRATREAMVWVLNDRVLPVLDICAHLLCNRLGISLVEEAYLRYLAARSAAAQVEEEN